MKAVVYSKSFSPERMVLQEVQKPSPGEGKVLVRVHNVSVNAADYRSMQLGIIQKDRIVGADIAGVVEETGQGAARFKVGDRVFGDAASAGFGGFAEFIVVPENLLASIPDGVLFEEAAALPMAAITALQALRDQGDIKPGQRVLIYGVGGGVGSYALQLTKYYGANVTAVCGTHNVERACFLGANEVFDYNQTDALTAGRQYDLILAINGNRSLGAYRRALSSNGVFVLVGGGFPQIIQTILLRSILSIGGKKIRFLSAKPNVHDLEFLIGLVKEGKLKVMIDRRFPLSQAGQAVAYLRSGHASGKVIIAVP
jgi:NADPH:quinone reductase-like Zn-dependent oxidoreductase